MIRVATVLALAAGCSSFEDEDIAIDLRVLAMAATPPEQVIAVDLSMPPNPSALLQQLVPTTVCALIADPGLERRVRYQFKLCVYGEGARCDSDFMTSLGPERLIDDPELAPRAQIEMCATIEPTGNLLGILTETLQSDPFAGLGGVDYLVSLSVGGEGADPALDQYAAKTVRVAPRIPDTRTANINPTIDGLEITVGDNPPATIALGRCAEQPSPFPIAAGQRVKLDPIEASTARETYVVPTIDGRTMMFTESLTYQWVATAGGFSSGSTGGPRDVSGNFPELFTEYRAPGPLDLEGPTDVQVWIIQRDERYGATWYETCLRVTP